MLRLKLLLLALIIGCVSSKANDPVVQLINISPDSVMDIVKVEFGDSILVDSLNYNEASAYLSVPATMGGSLTFTSLSDSMVVFELSGLDITDGEFFQSILYGVTDTNAYAENPDGKNMELNATWNSIDTSNIPNGYVRVNFFHAVSDAVEMDVADLNYEFIVDNMSFGEYSSTSTDLPADLRYIFFTTTDSVTVISSRSTDLGIVIGQTSTIFLSGFIAPVNNDNGPSMSIMMVDEAGNVTPLSLILASLQDELLGDVKIYPNPATNHVTVELSIESPMPIQLILTDLSGRQLMRTDHDLTSGLNRLHIDLPILPHGIYMVHLLNDSGQFAIPIVIR